MPKQAEVTLEAELLDATGVRKNKDRQTTLEKVCEAVSKLSDDDWAALSPEAQKWYMKAAKAYKAEQDLPDFPEAQEVGPSDDESEDVEQEASDRDQKESDPEEQENDMPTSTAKKKAVAKKANGRVKPAAAAKKSVSSGPRRGGEGRKSGSVIRTLIKEVMMKNPAISSEDIVDKLSKRGLKCSKLSVDTVRSEFRHTLRFLNDGDYLRKRIEL